MGSVARRGTAAIQHHHTSTTFDLPGYHVVESRGVVRGIIVRSRSIFGSFAASVETIFGGNISFFTTMCEKARENAFDIMLAHAQNLGANAVIGVRYESTELMKGVSEVLCYGTAVIIEEAHYDDPGHTGA